MIDDIQLISPCSSPVRVIVHSKQANSVSPTRVYFVFLLQRWGYMILCLETWCTDVFPETNIAVCLHARSIFKASVFFFPLNVFCFLNQNSIEFASSLIEYLCINL